MSLSWFLIVSCLPATPSDFARDVAGNWVQNPFCRNFAREIAFAFSPVRLNHYGIIYHAHRPCLL